MAVRETTSLGRLAGYCESRHSIGLKAAVTGKSDKPRRAAKSKGSGKAKAGSQTRAQKQGGGSSLADEQGLSDERETSDEQETCDVCCTPIVDGRDDALQCEGDCQKWLHRICAGVTKSHHIALSISSSPFTCWLCSQSLHRATVGQLHSELAALKTEVAELRAALESKSAAVSVETESWSEVVRRTDGSKRKKLASLRNRSNAVPGDSKKQFPPSSLHSNEKRDAKHSPSRARAQVEGKRKVWGTLKTCSAAAVKSAISSLTNVPSNELSIRRKYKMATTNPERVTKWWFVIGAEERVLTELQEQWHSVNLQTKWKLEPVFRFTEGTQSNLISIPTEPTSSMASEDLVPADPTVLPCSQSKHASIPSPPSAGVTIGVTRSLDCNTTSLNPPSSTVQPSPTAPLPFLEGGQEVVTPQIH